MTVTLTSEALGKQPGDTYTGPEEAWLLAQGYASKAGYADDAAAVLNGTTNAVNIVTGGNLVIQVDDETYTVALTAGDTPAQAATKIDTALSGDADAAIVSSKLKVTSVATGTGTTIRVDSGTGTVLANLGLTAGQAVTGTEGGPGVANTGPAAEAVADDVTEPANREPAGDADGGGHAYAADPDFDSGPLDPAMATLDEADPEDRVGGYTPLRSTPYPPYDFDPGNVDDDPSVVVSVTPSTGLAAGGTVVAIEGSGFEDATKVTFGGTDGTAFTHVDDGSLRVTTPPHAAGAVDVVVVDTDGNGTKVGGFTYA